MKHEYIVQVDDTDRSYDFAFVRQIRRTCKQLVRCRDCKWFDTSDSSGTVKPIGYRCKKVTRLWREPDDHCKGAERKDNDRT